MLALSREPAANLSEEEQFELDLPSDEEEEEGGEGEELDEQAAGEELDEVVLQVVQEDQGTPFQPSRYVQPNALRAPTDADAEALVAFCGTQMTLKDAQLRVKVLGAKFEQMNPFLASTSPPTVRLLHLLC